MPADKALTIGCLDHNPNPRRRWAIADKLRYTSRLSWRFFDVTKRGPIEHIFGSPRICRMRAALEIRSASINQELDLLISISHGCTMWGALGIGRPARHLPHLAFSFNFTKLPSGPRRQLLSRIYRRVDRFVVHSDHERTLYSEHFGIPAKNIDFVRWGVASPIKEPGPDIIGKPYVIAMGGEGRDYDTLIDVARSMPNATFVLVVRPWSLSNIDLPENAIVFTDIPSDKAWTLVHHARASIICLEHEALCCGIITLVGGMHLGKAHILTRSRSFADYVEHDESALLIPPNDPGRLRLAIERLLDDRIFANKVGETARQFASQHCSESTTLKYLERFLEQSFSADPG